MHGDVSSVGHVYMALWRMHSKARQSLSVYLVTKEPAFGAGALLNSRVAQLETMLGICLVLSVLLQFSASSETRACV